MFEDLLTEFTGSSQAENAITALTNNGFSSDEAQNVITEALPAARESMEEQVGDHPEREPEVGLFNIFGGHAAKSVLIGITEGIVRGDGVTGTIEDAGISLIAGHIGDVIAPKLGIDSEKAALAAAIVAPFIVHYAHEKLSSSN